MNVTALTLGTCTIDQRCEGPQGLHGATSFAFRPLLADKMWEEGCCYAGQPHHGEGFAQARDQADGPLVAEVKLGLLDLM